MLKSDLQNFPKQHQTSLLAPANPMYPNQNPMYGQTPSTEVLKARLAAAEAERNPPRYTPPTPQDIQATPIVKPLQDENKAYEAAILGQAKDRGLKGVAYVLEQKATEVERKQRVAQFYCAHTYVNVPVQWYGATVYPRICPKCGHIRSSEYAK